MKLNELPKEEMPREKAMINGVSSLSNAELIAILLRSGTRELSVIELSYYILKEVGGLSNLGKKTYNELCKIKGLKEAKALTLLATIEIAKRMNYTSENLNYVGSSEKIYELFEPMLRNEEQENCLVVFLNVKSKVICHKRMFIGGLSSHLVHPRDIFREAVKNNAAAIVLIHNHPSGDPSPSLQDIETTKSICELGEELGIRVIDHIIIGKGSYYSLREKKLY